MTWLWVSAAGNTVVALAYFAITGAIAIPLLRSGQWWSNRLGSATAAIFFTCAVGHGIHVGFAIFCVCVVLFCIGAAKFTSPPKR